MKNWRKNRKRFMNIYKSVLLKDIKMSSNNYKISFMFKWKVLENKTKISKNSSEIKKK